MDLATLTRRDFLGGFMALIGGPFEEDWMGTIVNVNWGGGAFVAGDRNGQLWYSKDGVAWKKLLYDGFGIGSGAINCSCVGKAATGKKIYITAGTTFTPPNILDMHVAYSLDGKIWKKADISSPYNVVSGQQTQVIFGAHYDKTGKKFILEGQFNDTSLPPDAHGNSFSHDLIWESTTGTVFDLVSNQQLGAGEGFIPKLGDFDGFVAHDSKGVSTASPNSVRVRVGPAIVIQTGPDVTIVKIGKVTKTIDDSVDGDRTVTYTGTGISVNPGFDTDPNGIVVGCAQLGKTLVAVGRSDAIGGIQKAGISVSKDTGKTWKVVVRNADSLTFNTVVGG